MSDHRRRVSVLAAGAVSLALLTNPLTSLAQDEAMASVGEACQAGNIDSVLKTPGRLTLSTDNPSFPPWWGGDPSVDPDSGWEVSYPPSGQGYEGATAYAVAAALGFTPDQIDWIQNAEFSLAFQPGPKAFDWHMAQISIRPERAEAIDFSEPYFDASQSLVAMSKNGIVAATTIEELKDKNLGAAVATTSLQLIEEVIQPNNEPQVFGDNAAAVQALQNGTIDGLIVDLYTAFYVRDAQLEDWDTPDPEATIVGQFGSDAQIDQMGMVLEKESPLTACVNEALAAVKDSGELQAIYDEWISGGEILAFE